MCPSGNGEKTAAVPRHDGGLLKKLGAQMIAKIAKVPGASAEQLLKHNHVED
jgi:hypothetical protein